MWSIFLKISSFLKKEDKSKTSSKPRLLIVDDDSAICDFLRMVATELNMEVVDATIASQALGIVDSYKPNIIILDLCMPDMDGVEVIAKLAEKKCDSSIVIVAEWIKEL